MWDHWQTMWLSFRRELGVRGTSSDVCYWRMAVPIALTPRAVKCERGWEEMCVCVWGGRVLFLINNIWTCGQITYVIGSPFYCWTPAILLFKSCEDCTVPVKTLLFKLPVTLTVFLTADWPCQKTVLHTPLRRGCRTSSEVPVLWKICSLSNLPCQNDKHISQK